MKKSLGQRVIESLLDSLNKNQNSARDSPSEADCVASKYMQRVLESQRRCAQKTLTDFYNLPHEIYFAHAIN